MKAKFGQDGIRDDRTYKPAITVKFGDGEHLHFKLASSGAEPLFGFACADRELFDQFIFEDHPTDVYEWRVGQDKDVEPDANDDVYALGLLFTTALKYTLVVQHRRANGTLIETCADIDYSSKNPNDKFTESFDVFSE